MPVSTAEYSPCGWRAWLNGTTVTLGVNNVFDLAPPFVAAAAENGYDEQTANIKGRTWYVAIEEALLRKLFVSKSARETWLPVIGRR